MAVGLKAPFPWFGGKSRVAGLVWERLGDVANYIEPFYGSGAVLLGRPHPPRIETVNDKFCFVANFWRAVEADPGEVARHADAPVNEADLHARHRWLVNLPQFAERVMTDPDYYDAKVAGWWVWGQSIWIGAGWCSARGRTVDGLTKREQPNLHNDRGVQTADRKRLKLAAVSVGEIEPDGGRKRLALPRGERGVNQRPVLDRGVRGINPSGRKLPDISGKGGKANGRGVLRQLPDLAGDGSSGRGVAGRVQGGQRAALEAWFETLGERMRRVRVCCGDWMRVCDSPSTLTRIGLTGVFLDPPYSSGTGRDMDLYAEDCGEIAHTVRAWCLKWGGDDKMRIALCGYAGEHEALERAGWDVVAWTAQGGYANRGKGRKGNTQRGEERIWFSPACLKGEDLFTWGAGARETAGKAVGM